MTRISRQLAHELLKKVGREKDLPKKVNIYKPYRNALERDFADVLEKERKDGFSQYWFYECLSLPIGEQDGKDHFYTPDFVCFEMKSENFFEIYIYETKGWEREAGMVRLRAAKKLYPEFTFKLVKRVRGEWRLKSV